MTPLHQMLLSELDGAWFLMVIIAGLLIAAVAAVFIDERERRERHNLERRNHIPQNRTEKLQWEIEREVASLQLQRAISAALADTQNSA